MSELTPCNYCTLQRIKHWAKKRGQEVTLKHDPQSSFGAAQAVYVYPKGVPGQQRFQEKHRVSWFAELTDHCVC